ncbi:MAG: lysoplasmalogenase, partial [Thermoanaerobaculia bacterium]|nr:lysoplasmalogenase [Thermoanaerobaculia bacterium]
MQTKSWLTAYLLVALTEIGAEVSATDWLVWCTKPLLMPLLFVWLYREAKGRQRFLSQTIRAGLLFAWLGDILLMFSGSRYGQLFFLLGLVAFLCTHLCYMGGFFRETNLRNGLLRKQPLLVAPFAVFLAVFLNWLWPDIPDGMKLPVAVYGTA